MPPASSAAPISGGLDECEVEFEHLMSVERVWEAPRVTKPYSEAQWQAIQALGRQIDDDLQAHDVRLTMGGEPTFVALDYPDDDEWNTAALGPNKRRLAADLFYRLNVVPLRLPPLRERLEDIPELVKTFLAKAAGEGLPWKIIEGKAIDRLMAYHWPGNVRELENLIHRLAALYSEETISEEAISAELADRGQSDDAGSNRGLSQVVEERLEAYFGAHAGALPAAGLYDRVLREVERPLIILTLCMR